MDQIKRILDNVMPHLEGGITLYLIACRVRGLIKRAKERVTNCLGVEAARCKLLSIKHKTLLFFKAKSNKTLGRSKTILDNCKPLFEGLDFLISVYFMIFQQKNPIS